MPGSQSNAQNGGWAYYEPTGYDGRSEGSVVCATKTNSKHNRAKIPRSMAPDSPAQQLAALNRSRLNSCHLAPSVLGGSGALDNVAPCWRSTNVGSGSMRQFETQAQGQLKPAGNSALIYVAMPRYATATSTIPLGFWLSYLSQSQATGAPLGVGSVYVPNTGDNQYPNLGN